MCSDICKSIRCHECHWASMGHNSGIQMNQKGWGILREQQGIKYWIPISILSNLKIIWLCCIDFFPLKCIVEIVNLMALARGILILLNVYCVVDTLWGFPGGSEVKASACNVGDLGSIPGSGRSLGEGNGNPLQYSYLENAMDGAAW